MVGDQHRVRRMWSRGVGLFPRCLDRLIAVDGSHLPNWRHSADIGYEPASDVAVGAVYPDVTRDCHQARAPVLPLPRAYPRQEPLAGMALPADASGGGGRHSRGTGDAVGLGQGVAKPDPFVVTNANAVGSAEGVGDAHSGEGKPSALNVAVDLLSPRFNPPVRRPCPTASGPLYAVAIACSRSASIAAAFLHIDFLHHTLRNASFWTTHGMRTTRPNDDSTLMTRLDDQHHCSHCSPQGLDLTPHKLPIGSSLPLPPASSSLHVLRTCFS